MHHNGMDVGQSSIRRQIDLWALLEVAQSAPSPERFTDVVRAIDVLCIALDQRQILGETIVDVERSGEGRYGKIKRYVKEILLIAGRAWTFSTVEQLIESPDEGVRWAVAALLNEWTGNIRESSRRGELLFRLLNDEHPWVFREIISQLSGATTALVGINPVKVFVTVQRRTIAHVKAGWDMNEFQMALLQFGASVMSSGNRRVPD